MKLIIVFYSFLFFVTESKQSCFDFEKKASLPFLEDNSTPKAHLSNGDTIYGIRKHGVEFFRGIPYAEPPVGHLRFKRPRPYTTTNSLDGFSAFDFGHACHSSASDGTIASFLSKMSALTGWLTPSPLLDAFKVDDTSEDCLTINVFRPKGVVAASEMHNSKLKVLVWIHGIGSSNLYPGQKFVEESVALKEPIIFVSLNYRQGPFGFLGGTAASETKKTNVGMWDCIEALKWVRKNIQGFGGDSSNITAVGDSAGAVILAHLMISNEFYVDDDDEDEEADCNEEEEEEKNDNKKPLFDAVILQSGGLLPLGPTDGTMANTLFWRFSEAAACPSEKECTSQQEALLCLQKQDEKVLAAAASKVSHSLSVKSGNGIDIMDSFLVWAPRRDGVLWSQNPYELAALGRLPDIPMVLGSQEDEGTIISFMLGRRENKTETDAMFLELFADTEDGIVQNFLDRYSEDLEEGAPFRTGTKNEIWPGFKRQATIFTDLFFQGPRRLMLQSNKDHYTAGRWSFLGTQLHNKVPVFGTSHGSSLFYEFYGSSKKYYASRAYRQSFVSFVNHHDPNGRNRTYADDDYDKTTTGGETDERLLVHWPEYRYKNRKEIVVVGPTEGSILIDKFRRDRLGMFIRHPKSWETN